MKLELKHLAPYLPYGLKCKSNTILFGEEDNGIYEMGLISMRGVLKGTGKPILRSLSDLQKDELYLLRLDSKTTGINNWGDLWFGSAVSLQDMEFILSKLFEWNIDVFGLIEKGLAIDINKI